MLKDITSLLLSKDEVQPKIGDCYVAYDASEGFTIQAYLGKVKGSYCLDYYYTVAFIKGLIKGLYERNDIRKGFNYFIDKEYIDNFFSYNVDYVLNHSFEKERLNRKCSLFNVVYSIEADKLKNWYTKNRIVDDRLPELFEFIPKKVNKSDLRVGNMYADKSYTSICVYVGTRDKKLGFLKLYMQGYSFNENLVIKENTTAVDIMRMYNGNECTYKEMMDSVVVWTNNMPSIYELDDNYQTTDNILANLIKKKKIALK